MRWHSPENRAHIVNILRSDQIVLCTTDTVLGLLANLSESAFAQINRIKGRSNKPSLILIENMRAVERFVDPLHIEKRVSKIMAAFWPGPLTIIFPAKTFLPEFLKGQGGTIGLRVPQHAGLQSILHNFDGLFSTSANLAGEQVPTRVEDVDPSILDAVGGVILDEAASYPVIPSTIIDASSSEIKLVREGVIPWSEITRVLDAG